MPKESLARFVFALVFPLALAAGCASKKDYRVKEVETQMNEQGSVGGAKVGVNPKGEAVVQETKQAAIELQGLVWENVEQERKLQAKREDLQRCREELSDPRLGGSGKVPEIQEVDYMKNPGEVKEELGIVETGELKMVREEFYIERLKREKQYGETLKSLNRMLNKYARECENDYRKARVRVGLPGERYKAKGNLDKSGRFIVTREAEQNLDDAFRIRSQEGTSASPAVTIDKAAQSETGSN